MQYLVIFKRFEIWLLLVLVAGLIWFAFRPEPDPLGNQPKSVAVLIDNKGKEEKETPEESPKDEGLRVEEVKVLDSSGGKIVELTLLGSSDTGEDIVLDDSRLVATTSTGARLPLFFEPFRELAVLRTGEDSLVTLKYWLEGATDTIWLDFEGKRLQAELP